VRFTALSIPGTYRIDLEPLADERGFFARTFCHDEFAAHGLITQFVQRSISFNKLKATLRGLHYQAAPNAETKIVRCTMGSAYDVVVDLRRTSPAFGRWHAEIISQENHAMLYIPEGCAHGFQALVDGTEIYYEITPAYVAGAARGVAFDDPALAITWPLPKPIVSTADRARPNLLAADLFA
jgi:dTDP-4-dehydrorhamnose 3,5-epimerase